MDTKNRRFCGILLHPTSLFTPYGIGDIGPGCRKFIRLLAEDGIRIWQVLPLGPTGYGNSPYAARSSFAGNELLLSLDDLKDQGLLLASELVTDRPPFPWGRVAYDMVMPWKIGLLKRAAERFLYGAADKGAYEAFCADNSYWLDDYALFMVLYERFGDARWHSIWPEALGRRNSKTLAAVRKEQAKMIEVWKVLQFFFDVQWHRLKETANSLGISIVGDIPIFVAPDSVDSWSHIELFKTDEAGRYSFVSGVPPDYFSVTGQLWGNPVYDWKVMQENGYEWWLQRLKRLQELTDIIRIDHFRGFQAYWSVPYGNPTAEIGTWEKAPGMDFFCKVKERFPAIRIFAEDLGVITPDVEALRDSNGFPGMRIAQFGFTFDAGGKLHPYDTFLPHNYGERCVAYTGTHDNQTVKGWFEDLKEKEKKQVCSYLGCTKQDVCAGMVKAVMQSHARYAIFPLQDILGLGDEARMNTPATCGGHNWAWQLMPEADLTPVLSDLREKIFLYGRM